MTVYEALAKNRSGALILRLIAAGAVFWAHASQALALNYASFNLFGETFPAAEIGLLIFFGLSGILIAATGDKLSFREFAIRRIKRIWPGLTFMVLVTGLFLGPLIASKEGMAVGKYFGLERHLGLEYLASPFYIFATSPGAFTGLVINPNMPGGFNGSLWTIPIEIQCYVASVLVSRLIQNANLRAQLRYWIATSCYVLMLANPFMGEFFNGQALGLVAAFFYGSAIASKSFSAFSTVAGLGLPLILGLLISPNAEVSIAAILAPIFAIASAGVVRILGRLPVEIKSDYSFGLYLWHYPIIQTLWVGWHDVASELTIAFWAIMFSGIAAFVSWHFVEKKFLKP
jgi:peptidoglycan/LPS O-acetylase OafA/YrhL